MAFKKRAIPLQNKKENKYLHKLHLESLTKTYKLSYNNTSETIIDEGNIQSLTMYNVPILKMADSLANADSMVQTKRL